MNRAQAIEAAAQRAIAVLSGVDIDEFSLVGASLVLGAVNDLRKALAMPADEPVCQWTRVEGPYPELWETECRHVETITAGEMGWLFCPFCGQRIESIEPAQDGAE